MADSINLDALDRALGRLKSSYAFCCESDVVTSERLSDIGRSAAIQGFEFTFELATKVLRRHLDETNATPDVVAELSYPDLMRKGYARGILSREYEHWHGFRRLRSMTNHTYTETSAAEVFRVVPDFIDEIEKMAAAIRAERVA